MTPQQRLQEAKDQCAKEFKIGERWFMPTVLEPFEKRMDRVAEIMYEAGKEESNAQVEKWQNRAAEMTYKAKVAEAKSEIYHKALVEMLVERAKEVLSYENV